MSDSRRPGQFRNVLRLLIVLVLAGFAATAWAVKPTERALPDYDAAGGLMIATPGRTLPTPAQQAALNGLEHSARGHVRVTLNGLNGTPRSVWSRRPLSLPS